MGQQLTADDSCYCQVRTMELGGDTFSAVGYQADATVFMLATSVSTACRRICAATPAAAGIVLEKVACTPVAKPYLREGPMILLAAAALGAQRFCWQADETGVRCHHVYRQSRCAKCHFCAVPEVCFTFSGEGEGEGAHHGGQSAHLGRHSQPPAGCDKAG